MAGTLYVIATPIGNLEDITYRAVRILGEVAVVACEDTRQTRKLLDHFGVSTAMVSFHEHNEAARTAELMERLVSGDDVGLVTDAGTPLVSDPGFRLVRAAAQGGIRVVPIPGACAAIAALSAAGLPSDRFVFAGFPPRKSGERARFFKSLADTGGSILLYEAPHRILDTLADIAVAFKNPNIVAGRELTKLHEEFLRGTAEEVRAILSLRDVLKGEFTLVIDKPAPAAENDESLEEGLHRLEKEGLSRMEAIKTLAKQRGLPKREVYAALERLR